MNVYVINTIMNIHNTQNKDYTKYKTITTYTMEKLICDYIVTIITIF